MAWWWLGALPLAACGIVLFLFNPSQYSFYPRCALYTMTGIYCPGCGSTRALYQLAHGHLLTALHYNLLLILSLPFVGYYSWPSSLFSPSCEIFRARPSRGWPRPPGVKFSRE
jgi:hypothetical protein